MVVSSCDPSPLARAVCCAYIPAQFVNVRGFSVCPSFACRTLFLVSRDMPMEENPREHDLQVWEYRAKTPRRLDVYTPRASRGATAETTPESQRGNVSLLHDFVTSVITFGRRQPRTQILGTILIWNVVQFCDARSIAHARLSFKQYLSALMLPGHAAVGTRWENAPGLRCRLAVQILAVKLTVTMASCGLLTAALKLYRREFCQLNAVLRVASIAGLQLGWTQ